MNQPAPQPYGTRPDPDFDDRMRDVASERRGQFGDLERDMHDMKDAEKRMESHELKQERMRFEEQEGVIRQRLQRGEITEADAQKVLARGRMHEKIDEEGSAFRLDEAAAAGASYMTTQQILEDVLDTEDKILCIRWIKGITGYAWVMRKAQWERQKRSKPDYIHRFPRIEKMVHGKPQRVQPGMSKTDQDAGSVFESVLGFFLICNAALIGIQASGDGEEVMAFMIMEHIFTTVFTLELIFRLLSDGWIWITEFLNFCDFGLIVVTGILPMWILGPLGIKSNAMRMLQVLRVLRLIKLVRMVRTVPMFRIFWTLIRGLLDSGRTLLWTYVIIFAVLYVFAIFGVYLIGRDESFAIDDEAQEIANEYFGSVPKTFVTLFQVMTLDSWCGIARPLMRHSDIVSSYFVVFILIVVLALGNLVTAVIISNADSMGAQDEELIAKVKRDEAAKDIDDIQEMFLEMDQDGGGSLSKEEYDEALRTNPRVIQKFEVLGFSRDPHYYEKRQEGGPPDECDEIFDLLDTGSGEVGVQHFAAGLRDMQGDAKAKDSFTICKKVAHINKNLGNLSVRLKRQQETADELRSEITEAHRQMGGMLVELRDVMQYLAVCLPADDCKRPQKELDELDSKLETKRKRLSMVGLPEDVQPGAGALRTHAPQKQAPSKHVGFTEMDENISPDAGKQGQMASTLF